MSAQEVLPAVNGENGEHPRRASRLGVRDLLVQRLPAPEWPEHVVPEANLEV